MVSSYDILVTIASFIGAILGAIIAYNQIAVPIVNALNAPALGELIICIVAIPVGFAASAFVVYDTIIIITKKIEKYV